MRFFLLIFRFLVYKKKADSFIFSSPLISLVSFVSVELTGEASCSCLLLWVERAESLMQQVSFLRKSVLGDSQDVTCTESSSQNQQCQEEKKKHVTTHYRHGRGTLFPLFKEISRNFLVVPRKGSFEEINYKLSFFFAGEKETSNSEKTCSATFFFAFLC